MSQINLFSYADSVSSEETSNSESEESLNSCEDEANDENNTENKETVKEDTVVLPSFDDLDEKDDSAKVNHEYQEYCHCPSCEEHRWRLVHKNAKLEDNYKQRIITEHKKEEVKKDLWRMKNWKHMPKNYKAPPVSKNLIQLDVIQSKPKGNSESKEKL
ncbi:hypothetical protein WA158_008153 [Blastocystis sp. Blastoise]